MLQVNIDKMIEGGIAEGTALVEQVAVEGFVVVAHHLLDDGQLRTLGLQEHQPLATFAACPAADLCHHHEGMLVGAEVGIVEHGVGIEDAHHGDFVEIQSLGDHLCADEQVGTSGGEVADEALVG